MKIDLVIPRDAGRGLIPGVFTLTKEQLNTVLIVVDDKQYLLGISTIRTSHGTSAHCPEVFAGRADRCPGHNEDVLIVRPLR